MRNKILAGVCVLAFGVVGCASSEPGIERQAEDISKTVESFSVRPTTARIPLVDKSKLTAQQAEMLANRADYNIYKTLAHHVDLYNAWSPLGQIMLSGSQITPRHRELAMLRTGWLCQSEYEWAQHARIAYESVGLTVAEINRIAEGADASGWSEIDRAVLNMADELRYDATISDATWSALRTHYSEQEVMELLFTAAQYQLVSMALNSFGIQLDDGLAFRLPADVPLPDMASQARPMEPASVRLSPVLKGDMNAEQRAIVRERFSPSGKAPNFHYVMLNHPKLYGPRDDLARYINSQTELSKRERELLILRTAHLLGAEYVVSHHTKKALLAGVSAYEIDQIKVGSTFPEWSSRDALILKAAEDLRREAFITDETWGELSKVYTNKQLVEIVYTVGVYTMTSQAVNAFGVELEGN